MKRALHKAQTRRLVLEVAKRHFEESGFDRTHLRDIAREAGVAVGTVLLHFTDKEDLLHSALFEELEHAVNSALETIPGGSLEARLSHITR